MGEILKNILVSHKGILKENGFESFSLDVELLLMKSINFKKIDLYLNPNYQLSNTEFEMFVSLFKRRLANEPIAYILGKCEFMGMDFKLNEHTLIPRPDTEILVEKAIDIINEHNLKTVLDIGTGSGAIAISLAKFCPNTNVLALDINASALGKARENAISNEVKNISFNWILTLVLWEKQEKMQFQMK